MNRQEQIQALQKDWDSNPRWKGIKRHFTAEDVVRLRGSVQVEHTLARRRERASSARRGSCSLGSARPRFHR